MNTPEGCGVYEMMEMHRMEMGHVEREMGRGGETEKNRKRWKDRVSDICGERERKGRRERRREAERYRCMQTPDRGWVGDAHS